MQTGTITPRRVCGAWCDIGDLPASPAQEVEPCGHHHGWSRSGRVARVSPSERLDTETDVSIKHKNTKAFNKLNVVLFVYFVWWWYTHHVTCVKMLGSTTSTRAYLLRLLHTYLQMGTDRPSTAPSYSKSIYIYREREKENDIYIYMIHACEVIW